MGSFFFAYIAKNIHIKFELNLFRQFKICLTRLC